MKNSIKILLLLILLQPIYSIIKVYKNDEVYIVNKSFFLELERKNDCGFNSQLCKKYFNDINLFLNDVINGDLEKEEILIKKVPYTSDSNKALAPYKFLLEKNGITYYLPKYIYNPNLKNTPDIINKHKISNGDTILVYFLFNRVLFAEIISKG